MRTVLCEVTRDVGKYEELARRTADSGDDELAGYFRGIHEEDRRRAEKGGRLLAGGVAE